MKVLVTGGAGFIGTHVCRLLIDEKHEVTSLDIASPRFSVKGVRYESGDVRVEADLRRAIKDVDAVYHFAAIVSVPRCQAHPIESYGTNLVSTCNLLDVARDEMTRRGKPVRVIFASSAAVYGMLGEKQKPLPEHQISPQPLSFYGAQKLGSEQAMSLFHRINAMPTVVFRFFNVYGAGQDPTSPYSGVISVFSEMFRAGRTLRLNDGGNQTRDFVSVHDVARACILALSLPESACTAEPINLGSSKAITIRQLAEVMTECMGSKLVTEDAPAREGDIMHSLADTTRAKKLLNWSPQISLADGLKELLDG